MVVKGLRGLFLKNPIFGVSWFVKVWIKGSLHVFSRQGSCMIKARFWSSFKCHLKVNLSVDGSMWTGFDRLCILNPKVVKG